MPSGTIITRSLSLTSSRGWARSSAVELLSLGQGKPVRLLVDEGLHEGLDLGLQLLPAEGNLDQALDPALPDHEDEAFGITQGKLQEDLVLLQGQVGRRQGLGIVERGIDRVVLPQFQHQGLELRRSGAPFCPAPLL